MSGPKQSEKPRSGFVHRLVRALSCHQWETSGVNGFYLPVESVCTKCGVYRHRVVSAERINEIPEWMDGRHPKSSANKD